jgi:glycerol-3-phosphate dehydrogenase
VRGTRGAHIVVDAPRTGGNHAIVLRSRNDDRVMFRIPWGARAIIGTTDLDYSGDPAEVHATTEEVDYLLATTNDHFPGAKLTRDDVISTYAGVRPLVHEDEGSPSEVSREHQVLCGGDGTVTVVGGKLTTYRSMAEEIVDRVVEVLGARGGTVDGRALRIPAHGLLQRARERWEELADGEVLTRRGTTARRVLPGAIGVAHRDGPARVQRDLERAFGDRAVAQHLLLRYGGRAYGVAAMAEEDPELARRISADTPSIWAEVPFAARHDLALTLEDVLDRRTSVLLTDRAQGLEAADRAAELLAPLLGWDDAARRREVAAYGRAVARTRRWKDDQKGSSASGPSSANGTSSSGGADSSEDAPAGASGAS